MLALGVVKWKEKLPRLLGNDVGQLMVESGIRVRGRYMFAGYRVGGYTWDDG